MVLGLHITKDMAKTVNRRAQLGALRQHLLSERAKLTSGGRSTLEVLISPANVATEDQVSVLHEQLVALARHTKDRERLSLIDATLERMDRREFGICEACDEEIPPLRLRAVPCAPFCVRCQERVEENSPGARLEELFQAT
jgi:DnaK suppressor protein